MDILVVILVTAVVAGGGVWMLSRESKPAAKDSTDARHPT
jgi:hypothetical protein